MRKEIKPDESELSELIEKPDGTDESGDNGETAGQVDPGNHVDPANQVDPPWLEKKKQKGWFSWGIFAFAALFATTVTLVNAWVGPDEHYSDCALYHHHESEQDREERLLKLHLRLRRAEVLQNRDAIQMASWELARAVRETDPQKEAVLLRECIATQSGNIFPYDQARLDLCNVYLRLKRYEEAKEVIDAWRKHPTSKNWVGFWSVPFYETAAKVYEQAGDQNEAAQFAALAEKNRMLPQAGGSGEAHSPLWIEGSDAILSGNYTHARKCFEKIANSNDWAADRARLYLPCLCMVTRDFRAAGEYFPAALEVMERTGERDRMHSQWTLPVVHAYAKYLRMQGKRAEAEKYFALERKLQDRIFVPLRENFEVSPFVPIDQQVRNAHHQ